MKISASFPMWSIAKKHNLPYWVVLCIADGIKKEYESVYWTTVALAKLTEIVGAWNPGPDVPETQWKVRRAMLIDEVLYEIDSELRKHHGLEVRTKKFMHSDGPAL